MQDPASELLRIHLPRTPLYSCSACKTGQEISHTLGRSAGFIPGGVHGANLVAEVARGRLVDYAAPEVFAVPLHTSLVCLPISAPAQHDRSPVVGLGWALIVVHTSAYLNGPICPRGANVLHLCDHWGGLCQLECSCPDRPSPARQP